MAATSRTYADIDGFISMLLVACEDATINATLQELLSQPNPARKAVVLELAERLRSNSAPPALIEAIVCLLDDELAEKTFQAIYQCARKER